MLAYSWHYMYLTLHVCQKWHESVRMCHSQTISRFVHQPWWTQREMKRWKAFYYFYYSENQDKTSVSSRCHCIFYVQAHTHRQLFITNYNRIFAKIHVINLAHKNVQTTDSIEDHEDLYIFSPLSCHLFFDHMPRPHRWNRCQIEFTLQTNKDERDEVISSIFFKLWRCDDTVIVWSNSRHALGCILYPRNMQRTSQSLTIYLCQNSNNL